MQKCPAGLCIKSVHQGLAELGEMAETQNKKFDKIKIKITMKEPLLFCANNV